MQIFLRMNRLDLAKDVVNNMRVLEDDHCLTVLAKAWCAIAEGGKRVQDAVYAYEELTDKYGGSPMLLNGLAVANMHAGNFGQAETLLQEALTKAPSDADSLANLIVAMQHLNRTPEVVARTIR